jgi:endonuclease YncB( thermonuclease family)
VPPAESAPATALAQQAAVAPVTHLHELPVATWKNLSTFVAQRYGINRLSRDFLTQFVALDNCSLWRREQNDEFAMEDHRRLAKEEISKDRVATRIRIPIQIQLDPYDFDRGGFPLPQFGSLTVPTRNSCAYAPNSGNNTIPYNYTLQFTESAQLPSILPVSRERGHSLVATFNRNRSVQAEFVVDLIGLQPADSENTSTIAVRPVAVFVWADEHEQRFVGVAGAAAADAETETTEQPPPQTPPPPPSGNEPAPTTITGSGQLEPTGIAVSGQAIRLQGIDSLPLPSTPIGRRLAAYFKSAGTLTCDPRPTNTYRCLTAANKDIAEVALINGAARASTDAPSSYQDLENTAKQQRKGIWR